MNLFLFGRGQRLFRVVDSFSAKKQRIYAVTDDDTLFAQLAEKRITRLYSDPAHFDLAQLRVAIGPEDVAIVVESDEPRICAVLDNLRAQNIRAPLVVLSEHPVRGLAEKYPGVTFRNDRDVYRAEMRGIVRRMETRARVAFLRELVRSSAGLGIVIWGNPDPDAMASARALQALLADTGRDILITYMGEFTRPENQAMKELLHIPMRKYQPDLFRKGFLTATVDAQPSFFSQNGEMRFDVVIDHHPLTTQCGPKFMDIRPEYGSTCTILTEYFRECGVRMDRRIATGLFFGLKVDTANLTRNVHPADVEAYGWLLERIDENMLRSIEWTQVPQQTLDYFAIGLARRRTFGDVIVSNVGAVENPDVAVSVADFFIKVSGISIAVVWARAPDRIIVIFRSDGLSKNAGKVAKELFDAYGTAGGHRTMARAEILLEKVPELAPADETQTEHWLLRHLARVLHGVRKHWRPA